MSTEARDLAAVFKRAARPGVLETDFRQAVETHLLELAQQAGIDLTSRTEVTLGSSGRADTIYNRFIIEWEKPGSLKPSNAATKNRDTIAQCYGDSLFRGQPPETRTHRRLLHRWPIFFTACSSL